MDKYAYLGEIELEEFPKILGAFPSIVGIGATEDGEIVLGVPREMGDEVVGMYQMIVSLWGHKDLVEKVFEDVLNW